MPEVFEKFDAHDDYRGSSLNLLFADRHGNIGYKLTVTHPMRKDKTPYIGALVLDGTTTEFDWTGEVVP